MLDVDVHYSDLQLPIRKALASRHALLTLKEAAWAANDPQAQHFSRRVSGALETLKVPIASPDSDRLDTFVAAQVQALLPVLSTPLSAIGVCCTKCTGTPSVACDGVSDAQYVGSGGHCVLPIKECCAVAVRTMRRLYASVSKTGMLHHAVVNFEVATSCPVNAVYCVSGSSSYKDHSTRQSTYVKMRVGLEHWDLDSYAALALILAHELVCHAGHGLHRHAPRGSTSADDRYIEGWMDFVARSALLAEVGRSGPATPMRAAQALAVAGVIAAWRTADKWRGSCEEKRHDSAAPHRRFGEKLASEAQAIFDQLGASEAFFEFSAAFNAADTTREERNDWLDDVDVVSSMVGGRQTHRVTRALKRFAAVRDIEEFRQTWRHEGGA